MQYIVLTRPVVVDLPGATRADGNVRRMVWPSETKLDFRRQDNNILARHPEYKNSWVVVSTSNVKYLHASRETFEDLCEALQIPVIKL